MAVRFSTGIDDFRSLRERGYHYVDKSGVIRELLDAGDHVVLLPRPRRFGKTLNLSTLRYWFEKTDEDLSHLFQDLAIWSAGDDYRATFQRYPVIHFNFKGTRGPTFEHSFAALRYNLAALFDAYSYLLDGPNLTEREAHNFRNVVDRTAEQATYERALFDLSTYLHRYHGEKVVILIDEYDEPIHAGHMHGYGPEILGFMRAFLGAALKSNVHLERAVLTGILRVAKENLFSGLNNVGVYSLLAPRFSTCFGFTEAEVATLLDHAGRSDQLAEVRSWYNGYFFGGQVIYNPWSVLSYLGRPEERPKPYWLSTSSNELVHELLTHYAVEVQPLFEMLLEGGTIERPLNDNVVLSDLTKNSNALWSLLVFTGYLKAIELPDDDADVPVYGLSIPNREVRIVYSTSFQTWMTNRMDGSGTSVERLKKVLLAGDAAGLEEQLQGFVENLLSYHDTGKLYPEQVYQGFLIGLFAVLEPRHRVRSNRESGFGRPDVLILPKRQGDPGVVLEFKVARAGKKTLEQALDEGLLQLEKGAYDAELRAAGASPIHAFAVAFDGKEVRVVGRKEEDSRLA